MCSCGVLNANILPTCKLRQKLKIRNRTPLYKGVQRFFELTSIINCGSAFRTIIQGEDITMLRAIAAQRTGRVSASARCSTLGLSLSTILILSTLYSNHAASTVDLASRDPKIIGANSNGLLGWSMNRAGDVNHDGFDDMIIGTQGNALFVLFGGSNTGSTVDLAEPTTEVQGFQIVGTAEDLVEVAVNAAGDVNGDGIDDIIVGAPYASKFGLAYVIYGTDSNCTDVDLTTFAAGVHGFTIIGESNVTRLGYDVSSAGDVNSDGHNDILIGSINTDRGASNAYVILGGSLESEDLDLASFVSGTDGFKVNFLGGNAELLVAAAGDVNGDGYADVIAASSTFRNYAGIACVVFGKASGFVDVTCSMSIDPSEGFAIAGSRSDDQLGTSLSGAGDFNRDGFDDVIVGTSGYRRTAAYVIFGSHSPVTVDLSGILSAGWGFAITRTGQSSISHSAVSGGRDVNGDGISDIVAGYAFATNSAGVAYVLYGRNYTDHTFDTVDLDNFNSSGMMIVGAPLMWSGWAVALADMNGDGSADVLVSAPRLSESSGAAFMIPGAAPAEDSEQQDNTVFIIVACVVGGTLVLGSLCAAACLTCCRSRTVGMCAVRLALLIVFVHDNVIQLQS